MKKIKTGELIGKTSRLLNNNLSGKLARANMGLTSEQWIILQILLEGPKNQKELGEITLKNKSSINSLISNLHKSGFIEKAVSQTDKRNAIVSISETGIKARGKSSKIALQSINEATIDFTKIEIEELNNYLLRIINNLLKN